jgi:hypothetical protein
MYKEFVPYEEALALKELGFDEKCYTYYYKVREHDIIELWSENYYLPDVSFPITYAPFYRQAFKWLRDKHGVMHRITSYAFGYQIHLDNTTDPKFWGTDWRFDSEENFSTYEEAELAALKKIIEILTINSLLMTLGKETHTKKQN